MNKWCLAPFIHHLFHAPFILTNQKVFPIFAKGNSLLNLKHDLN